MNEVIARAIDEVDKLSPGLGAMLEEGFSYAPYISNFMLQRKINRLQRRLNENSEQVKRIGQLYSNSMLSAEYINERIFPIVLGDLIEEHEDAKITLILNGFENVFINENTNESVLINHYDTLRSLRYADIQRLLFLYHGDEGDQSYSFEENSEECALIRNIDVKLEKLGFFQKKSSTGMHFKPLNQVERRITINNVLITLYCEKFVGFITRDT